MGASEHGQFNPISKCRFPASANPFLDRRLLLARRNGVFSCRRRARIIGYLKMQMLDLEKRLCKSFCNGITVNAVATGYAISSFFEGSSGDRIGFYLSQNADGFVIEDDGSYLSELIAKDIRIDDGMRGQLLDAILLQANAYWDRDTYEIRTPNFSGEQIERRVTEFLSSMIRIRDLELLTRNAVKSTFREDAIRAIKRAFDGNAEFEENAAASTEFSEFPSDLIILPHSNINNAKTGAVYFVNSNDKLNEALLLQFEVSGGNADQIGVVALIEEPKMNAIGTRQFQRAQNRSLTMPIFRGDERAAVNAISRRLGFFSAGAMATRNLAG